MQFLIIEVPHHDIPLQIQNKIQLLTKHEISLYILQLFPSTPAQLGVNISWLMILHNNDTYLINICTFSMNHMETIFPLIPFELL